MAVEQVVVVVVVPGLALASLGPWGWGREIRNLNSQRRWFIRTPDIWSVDQIVLRRPAHTR